MRKVADGLETVGVGDFGVGEQVEQLLGGKNFVGEDDLVLDELDLGVGFTFIILEQLDWLKSEQRVYKDDFMGGWGVDNFVQTIGLVINKKYLGTSNNNFNFFNCLW